jgi:hypothetical protein
MWIALVFSCFFFWAALVSLFGPVPNHPAALVSLAQSGLASGLWATFRSQAMQAEAFTSWLRENSEAIRSRGVVYDSVVITLEMPLRRYLAILSFPFIWVECRSTFILTEQGFRPELGVAYCAGSSLMGWSGLRSTAAAIAPLATNIRSGERLSVGDLLDELTWRRREFVRLTPGAAEAASRWMAAHNFPEGSGILIEVFGRPDDPKYQVAIDDRPRSDGRFCVGESEGIRVLVEKRYAKRLEGLLVDHDGRQFVFQQTAARAKTSVRVS